MMMRKTSLILLGAAAGIAGSLIAIQPRIVLDGARAQAAAADTYRQLSLFGDVFERVRTDYVEKPDDSKLIESAINGMLAGLDPHSSYMDSKSFRDIQVQTRGEFGGLGIEVTMEDGLLKVVAPIDETPAAKAGIMANDIITHLDDVPVQGLALDQAVEKMRGPENSKIKLKIVRKGQDKPIEVSITRARIQVRSVRSRLEGDDVGFIRVTQFNEQTTENLKKAITELSAQAGDKLKGFIIDLRNNPGGLLDQAVSVSNAFLERGEIVSTRGRTAEETLRFNARAGDLAKNKPVIVLINGGSASASEIVAGALQDHRRATVIGTRSFGKGSVQTIIPLGEGRGALRLTLIPFFVDLWRWMDVVCRRITIGDLQSLVGANTQNVRDIMTSALIQNHGFRWHRKLQPTDLRAISQRSFLDVHKDVGQLAERQRTIDDQRLVAVRFGRDAELALEKLAH
jgi:carboxyl-terminal processing protease